MYTVYTDFKNTKSQRLLTYLLTRRIRQQQLGSVQVQMNAKCVYELPLTETKLTGNVKYLHVRRTQSTLMVL